MNAGIAIFVKTPGHSPLKTRLAAATGAEFACAWYERAAAVVAHIACSTGATVYWAVAESSARRDRRWSGLPQLAQGEGSLGTRLYTVQQQLLERHDAGLMIGADSPQLSARSLGRALDWLLESATAKSDVGRFWAQPKAGALCGLGEPALACGENRPIVLEAISAGLQASQPTSQANSAGLQASQPASRAEGAGLQASQPGSSQPPARQVIGPATDGGFWLYGSNRVLARSIWEGLPYSDPGTAACLRAAATHNGDWLELEVLRDVDTLDDLHALQAAQADEGNSQLAALCGWTRQSWPPAR